IQGDDLLAAIVDGVPVVGAVLGGAEAPEVVAFARQLGLDHLRAELRHEGAAEGPGHDLRQLENADAGQGQRTVGHDERRDISRQVDLLASGGRGKGGSLALTATSTITALVSLLTGGTNCQDPRRSPISVRQYA